MTVRDLIQRLEAFDPELPVVIEIERHERVMYHDDVDFVREGKNIVLLYETEPSYPKAVVLI